jgi:hypothetical protein
MKGRDELKERKKEEPCRVLAVDNIFDMSTPSDTNDIITRKRLHSNGRAERERRVSSRIPNSNWTLSR